MNDLVESYIDKTEKDGVLFCFRGPMTLKLLESLEGTLKRVVGQKQDDFNTVFKVFAIFVEQVQNVLRYSADKVPSQELGGETLGSGVVIIGHGKGGFFVSCGNMIENSNIPNLKEELTKIQSMDKIELKKYFRERRKEDLQKEQKNAGLGLIEMARMGQEIRFGFTPRSESRSLFSITVTV